MFHSLLVAVFGGDEHTGSWLSGTHIIDGVQSRSEPGTQQFGHQPTHLRLEKRRIQGDRPRSPKMPGQEAAGRRRHSGEWEAPGQRKCSPDARLRRAKRGRHWTETIVDVSCSRQENRLETTFKIQSPTAVSAASSKT